MCGEILKAFILTSIVDAVFLYTVEKGFVAHIQQFCSTCRHPAGTQERLANHLFFEGLQFEAFPGEF